MWGYRPHMPFSQTVRFNAKTGLQALTVVLYFVFLGQIKRIWDNKVHHIISWKNWMESEAESSARWDMMNSLRNNYELNGKTSFMPNKIIQKSHINRLTNNKEYNYPYYSSEVGEIEFTHNFNTGYYKGLTFKRIKGGGDLGGNYNCVEQNDEYRISKY